MPEAVDQLTEPRIPAVVPPARPSLRHSPSWFQARWWPLLALAGLAASAIMVRLGVLLQVPLPFCLLRNLTGVPCPACGSTRSLLAWARLDPLAALRLNPLFFALCVSLAFWALARLGQRWIGWPWSPRWPGIAGRWRNTWLLVAILALNWVYLCFTLPK